MRIHFIGIGGIGVSALAKYYLKKGWEVSGCDLVSSEITDQLKKMGVTIRTGAPDLACSAGAEKIVYSPAVPKTHIEISNFKFCPFGTSPAGRQHPNKSKILNTKFQVLSYPQALGELTREHFTISVSGCHGKSTTTAMIGLILAKAGLNPTVIVGTKVKEFGPSTLQSNSGQASSGSNFRMGGGKYLVIEADEHFSSFLNYSPTIAVITNIERDHLDFYKNVGNIKKAFKKYISFLPKEGILVINKDDKEAKTIVPKHPAYSVAWYSTKQAEAKRIAPKMQLPGIHNVSNAMAALAVARLLKIPDQISFASLASYKGSWRRFEIFDVKIENCKLKIVSDYGHHPTEIKATVEAARQKYPKKDIWLVFQPHQYQRTFYLWNDFVKVLSRLPIEKLIITDIYDVAGREEKKIKEKVSSEKLVKEILNTRLRPSPTARDYGGQAKYQILDTIYIPGKPPFKEIEKYLQENLMGGEVVMIMGAGDIYNLTLRLTQCLEKAKIKA